FAAPFHLKMQVRTRRAARVAYVRDVLAGPHLLPYLYVDGRSVRVTGQQPVAVVDDNEHAVGARPVGIRDASVGRGQDRRTRGRGNVQPFMQPVLSGAEERADDASP